MSNVPMYRFWSHTNENYISVCNRSEAEGFLNSGSSGFDGAVCLLPPSGNNTTLLWRYHSQKIDKHIDVSKPEAEDLATNQFNP